MTHNTIKSDICETQGDLYKYMAEQGCDMEAFSDAYLSSSFCSRAMDTIYSRFQLEHPLEILDFLMPEIKDFCPLVPEDKQCPADVAYWIGFTYRQLYLETDVLSAELAKKVPYDALFVSYVGLHTVDEEMATDIICKNHGLTKTGKW